MRVMPLLNPGKHSTLNRLGRHVSGNRYNYILDRRHSFLLLLNKIHYHISRINLKSITKRNTDMNAYLQNLNQEQLQAVLTTQGYVRVIAGPGTGKTRVLTSRHSHLIRSGVNPMNILSVTFTTEAAIEMRRRTVANIGYFLPVSICTFHYFCLGILKRNIQRLNYPNRFSIIDRNGQVKMLREIYSEMNVHAREYPPAEMIEYISRLKASLDYVPHVAQGMSADVATTLPGATEGRLNEIFVKYLRKMRKYRAVDLDDMLYFTLYLLRQHKDLLDDLQNELQYIQVDEFQDINQAQYDLIMLLHGKHKNLFVAGDPDQTIYSWQGSNIRFINEFDRNFPGAQTFMLTTNYRSSSSILDVSNSLIMHNRNRIDKPLVPVAMSEAAAGHYQAKNIYDEASYIALSIISRLDDFTVKFSDNAILYRASYMSRVVEEALIESGIPYIVIKGTAFYEREEIKDALAFLKLLAYGDNISFERIINKPARKMGKTRIYFLEEYAQEHKVTLLQALLACIGRPPFDYPEIKDFLAVFNEIKARIGLMSTSQVLDEILLKTGYEELLRHDLDSERLDNVMELKRAVVKQEGDTIGRLDITEYLAKVALYAEPVDGQRPNSVQLMTIHSCKGMEFPFVTVCGMNEGGLPSGKSVSEEEIEEERRLAYVAFSRAQKLLTLTSANGFDFNHIPLRPSRFLSEIMPGLIREVRMLN